MTTLTTGPAVGPEPGPAGGPALGPADGPAPSAASGPVAELAAEFSGAMAAVVSGLAVVTARGPDGRPCGLLVSSLCSYSLRPPSVLVAIDRSARSYLSLVECAEFGVHLLGQDEGGLADVFAGRGNDKFAGLPWHWAGTVPLLDATAGHLHCRTDRVFHHGDHAILIGVVTRVRPPTGPPLVHYRRRHHWRLG